MAREQFGLHGMTVASPIPLPAGTAPPGSAAEVEIHLVEEPPPLVATSAVVADCREPGPGYLLVRDGDQWTMDFPGALRARWRSDGAEIRVWVGPTTPALVPVLLGGPALTAVALSRGHVLLHASAVATVAGDALAFVGPPGSGKSSVARLLLDDGRMILSDDALRVDAPDEVASPLVHRGTTTSRLRTELTLAPGDVAQRSGDDRVTVRSGPRAPMTARLSALLLPLLSPDHERPRLRQLGATDALTQIAASWPLAGVEDASWLAGRLRWSSRLIARVPVLGLEVPWTSRLDEAERGTLAAGLGAVLGGLTPDGGAG